MIMNYEIISYTWGKLYSWLVESEKSILKFFAALPSWDLLKTAQYILGRYLISFYLRSFWDFTLFQFWNLQYLVILYYPIFPSSPSPADEIQKTMRYL